MNTAFLIPGFQGPAELLLILIVILLLFGSRRLPDLARALGKSLSEFKKGRAEGQAEEAGAPADATRATPAKDPPGDEKKPSVQRPD